MNEIKFTKKSFRPKQLLYELANSDEFEEVLILGVKKDGSLGYQASSTNFGFLAAVLALGQKLMLDQVQLSPESKDL